MYSVVLATMMTVSAGSTGWWNCHGCHGCWGSCYGCHGYYGCYGCYGCAGCSGCYGGYSFSGWNGCYGSSGCFGCSGSYGYYGSAVTYSYSAPVYFASSYVVPTYTAPSYYVASSTFSGGSTVAATAKQSQPGGDSQAEIARLRAEVEQLKQQIQVQKKKPLEDPSSVARGQPAQVTIHVPADAKLYIDDVACPLTSDTRSFTTPTLKPGQKYFYDVKAEVMRGGETVADTQRVVLEAGKEVSVTFPRLTAVATAQR
jgi:uncharacterized protein (TIGR03000 family)